MGEIGHVGGTMLNNFGVKIIGFQLVGGFMLCIF